MKQTMATVIFDPEKAKPLSEEEIEELKQLCNRPIDFSDIPETTEADWANARRGVFYRPVKQSDRHLARNQHPSKDVRKES